MTAERPLLDKLGIKPGQRIVVIGVKDGSFVEQLRARGAAVSLRRVNAADAVFFGASRASDLDELPSLKASLRKDGALWVVRPKGAKTGVTESATQKAGLEAGLVDVKVVSFSDTHTAEKFVFRLKDR